MSTNTILASAPLTATGYHLKATGTTLGQSLIWDNGTNVGIGNTNTSYTLDVSGTGRFTSNTYIGGTLGIGTTSASDKLNVVVASNGNIVRLDGPTSGLIFQTNATTTDIISYGGTTAAYRQLNFSTSASTNMTITTAGNVGIGTSSPATILHINSPAATNATIYFGVNGTMNGYLGQAASAGSLASGAAIGDIVLRSQTNLLFTSGGDTERMRITSAGKVNIGTESAPNSTAFNVAGADTSNDLGKFYLNATSSLDKALLRLEKYQNNSTTSQVFVNFTINQQATANGSITANGASQVTFTAWSDRRLKENITELSPQLQNILALKPSEFDYKDGSGHQIGFIAQEMQEVFPDAVGENGQGFLTVAGWNKTEAILVKAIQEMNTKLDAQNQTIQNLQEQINILAK